MGNIFQFANKLNVFCSIIIAVSANISLPAFATQRDVLQAVVSIETQIPPNARTAKILGTERQGSGVVIDNQGLVLTIGYLILEANKVMVTGPNSTQAPAAIVAYDHETGLGLIRITKKFNLRPMRLGNSSQLSPKSELVTPSSEPVTLSDFFGSSPLFCPQPSRPALPCGAAGDPFLRPPASFDSVIPNALKVILGLSGK